MFSLYSEDEIMEMFLASKKRETERNVAAKLIKVGKMSLDEIADSVPSISMEELKQMQEELATTAHA